MTGSSTAVRDTGVPGAAKLAGVQFVALGIGFGVGAIVTVGYFVRDGVLPMTPWGFRSLDGPLARIDPSVTIAAGTTLAVVELGAIAAGIGLWRGRRWAGRLGLAITPLSFALAVGFELPFLLAGIPLRVATLLLAWRRLR